MFQGGYGTWAGDDIIDKLACMTKGNSQFCKCCVSAVPTVEHPVLQGGRSPNSQRDSNLGSHGGQSLSNLFPAHPPLSCAGVSEAPSYDAKFDKARLIILSSEVGQEDSYHFACAVIGQ